MMKRQHKKTAAVRCLLLLLLIGATVFAGCGNASDKESEAVGTDASLTAADSGKPDDAGTRPNGETAISGESPAEPETDTALGTDTGTNVAPVISPVYPSLPVTDAPTKDYRGATVRVMCTARAAPLAFFSEDTPALCAAALKERNAQTEKRLGVKLVCETVSAVEATDKKDRTAGDSADLWWISGEDASQLMLYGSLSALPGLSDMASAGVCPAVWRDLSVYGNTYLLTGSANAGALDSVYAVACRIGILESVGYGVDEVRMLVSEGRWTLDRMQRFLSEVSASVDMTPEGAYQFWKGCGVRTVHKDPSDTPVVSVYDAGNVFAYEKVGELASQYTNTDRQRLFRVGTLGSFRTDGTENGKETLLLPMPCLCEGDGYLSFVDFAGCDFCAVPDGCRNPGMSADVLDVLYAVSVKTVYPVFLTQAFSPAGDTALTDGTAELLLSSRCFDLLGMYGIDRAIRHAYEEARNGGNFDELLSRRAAFVSEALSIALGQTVEN